MTQDARKPASSAVRHHEAGHAAVATFVRLELSGVSVIPGVENLGSCSFAQSVRPRSELLELAPFPRRQQLEPRIMTSMAGMIAERRFTGRRYGRRGAAGDMANIKFMLAFCFDTDRRVSGYQRFLYSITDDLVRTNWRGIADVVAALGESGFVSGERLREILCAAPEFV